MLHFLVYTMLVKSRKTYISLGYTVINKANSNHGLINNILSRYFQDLTGYNSNNEKYK